MFESLYCRIFIKFKEGEKNEVFEKSNEAPDYSDASKYDNDPELEMQWAIKAYQHAETYFNILSAIDSKILKLTKIDDDIYTHFRELFKDLKVDNLDVDHIKSKDSKEIWRPFCEGYKDRVEDYNMATLIRICSSSEYGEENTCIVPRIQWYAIEIARNREGHNASIKEKYGKITKKD